MTETESPIQQGEHTINDADNDAEAARLRARGFTYREIAQRVGCSPMTAHRRVTRALAAVPTEAVRDLRLMEDDRLDDLWKIAWREATRDDHVLVSHGRIVRDDNGHPLIDHAPKLRAVNTLLRIQERRAKLHGLDAPVTTRIEVLTEDALDAAIRDLEAELAERGGQLPADAD